MLSKTYTQNKLSQEGQRDMSSYYKINAFPNYVSLHLILEKDKQSEKKWQDFHCTIGLGAANFQDEAHVFFFLWALVLSRASIQCIVSLS
jgi:hypothetical protein